jgi:hypothetical protein
MFEKNQKHFQGFSMGAGDTSVVKCYLMHKKLEEIFNLMSGLQQPSHAETESEARNDEWQYEKGILRLKRNVLDIISDIGFTPEELMDCEYYQDLIHHNKMVDKENEDHRKNIVK